MKQGRKKKKSFLLQQTFYWAEQYCIRGFNMENVTAYKNENLFLNNQKLKEVVDLCILKCGKKKKKKKKKKKEYH